MRDAHLWRKVDPRNPLRVAIGARMLPRATTIENRVRLKSPGNPDYPRAQSCQERYGGITTMRTTLIKNPVLKLGAAAGVVLALSGCTSGGNLDPNAGVTVVDKQAAGTSRSYVMQAGANGMEYKPVTTSGGYTATVSSGGSTYTVNIDEKCYNSLSTGATTSVATLQSTCGDSISAMIRAPR